MASICKKLSHFILEKTWDKKNQATQDLQIAEYRLLKQNQGQSLPRQWKTWRQVYY
jgi:hypothetical protein